MTLSHLSYNQYIRRSAMEIDTYRRTEHEKTLELLLLENLQSIKGISIDCFYDSQHNIATYIPYIKKDFEYEQEDTSSDL